MGFFRIADATAGWAKQRAEEELREADNAGPDSKRQKPRRPMPMNDTRDKSLAEPVETVPKVETFGTAGGTVTSCVSSRRYSRSRYTSN